MSQVFSTRTPTLSGLLYAVAEASLTDYRDRSAPSDFHWKVLKCRMLIFSEWSILACPDYRDVRQIHVIFQNSPDCCKKVSSLFTKFSLAQKGELRRVSCEVLQSCLQYSVRARIAPAWNLLGKSYFVHKRDFLSAAGPQQAVDSSIYVTEERIDFHVKALKITLIKTHRPVIGDWVRVLPSLNKAIVEDIHETLPATGNFKSYKDLKRHWKNIHGYRLPEKEQLYYAVRFWRGEPLTYPELCIVSCWPIVVPVPKKDQKMITYTYLQYIQTRLAFVVKEPIDLGLSPEPERAEDSAARTQVCGGGHSMHETQAVSLCTPTPAPRRRTPSAQ